jgi:hypothetical protein
MGTPRIEGVELVRLGLVAKQVGGGSWKMHGFEGQRGVFLVDIFLHVVLVVLSLHDYRYLLPLIKHGLTP